MIIIQGKYRWSYKQKTRDVRKFGESFIKLQIDSKSIAPYGDELSSFFNKT